MPQSLQVKVGVVGDTSKIKQQIKDLQADMLKVDVSVDTAQAEKKLNTLVQKYNAKKITLDVDVGTGKNSGKNSIANNLTKQLDSAERKLRSFSEKAATALYSGSINKTAYDGLKKQIAETERQFDSLRQTSNLTAEDLSKLADVQRKLDQAFSKAKIQQLIDRSAENFNDNISSIESRVIRMRDQFERWVLSNARVSRSASGELSNFRNRFASILDDLGNDKVVEPSVIRKLGDDISTFKTKAQEAGMTGTTAFGRFSSKVKELGTYLLTSHLFMTFINGAQMVVQNVRELDSALTDLKKTTEGSAQDYANFMQYAADTAQEVGTKISDVISSAAEWSRSGFSLEQSKGLARASSIYTNVSEYETVSEATQSLISSMKAYGYEAENVMQIVDKLNAVGNTTATSSSGLGDALMRSASALSVAGNTIDESLGLIVAANDTVQNPEKVGNGLKTIALRLRNAKGELEELGEESDGAVESITKLQTQLLNNTSGRVNIFDQSGQFKSTYDILTELSNVWGDLDSVEQANITTMIAGATQANTFSSIMQNMGTGVKAVGTSLNSAGSALIENSRYMDSIEGRISNLSATFQELSANLLSSDLFKGIVSGATEALNIVNEFIETIRVLPTILGGVGIAAFIKNFA